MNFDEINKAMEKDNDELSIPLSVSELRTSQSSLKKLKKWIGSEVFALILQIFFLFIFYYQVIDHVMAQSLYKYTAFISIMANLGFITLQVRLLRRLKIDGNNSRRVIESYLVQIKSYYEVSMYITTGLSASFFVPISISQLSKNASDQYITDYLSFNLSPYLALHQIGMIVFLSLLVLVLGYLLFKAYPEKEIKKLEKTLNHF